MFTKDVNTFLSTSKRVIRFSFVENIYNAATKEWDSKSHITLNLINSNVFAAKGDGGNCILYSTDRLLIIQLYHLCRMCNYDAQHDEFGPYGTLMLVGCDGDCKVMGGISLFARVNGCNPDCLFDE